MSGSGPDGRIRAVDVQQAPVAAPAPVAAAPPPAPAPVAAAPAPVAPAPPPPTPAAPAPAGSFVDIPLTNVRQVSAKSGRAGVISIDRLKTYVY